MEMQQMMERLLAKMDATQERMDANTKSMREDIKSGQEEIKSIVDVWMTDMNDVRKETMYCQETTEANTEKTEPNPGIMQSVAEHQVVPKEEAIVKPAKGGKKWRMGRKLTAGRHREPNELTRRDCGSGKKLAAACRKVSSCATVTWQKRNLLKKFGTQGNCEPWSKLIATGIKMTHHERVAWHRERKCGRKDLCGGQYYI
jgi:hypothetical protein